MPTTTVKLDDGTGTYPYDITQYVRRTDGFVWQRGRGDELSTNTAGVLNLTLDNTDGRFTLGSTSGGYGAINTDRGVRITANGSTRWTGRIQAWPVSWPHGGDEFCVVQATATDALAALGRQSLRSAAREEILVDNPGGYYPLSEAAGATVAGDATGQAPPLKQGAPFPGSVVFGTDLGMPDGSTGALFTGLGTGATLSNMGGTTWTSTNSIHLDLVFGVSVGPLSGAGTGTGVVYLTLNGVTTSLAVNSGSVISFGGVIAFAASGILGDGKPHIISINGDSTATDLWCDGVKVQTGAGISGTWSNALCFLGDGFTLPLGAAMVLGHFNFGPKLSDARVLAHHNALRLDFLGETPQARIARLFTYAKGGYTTGTVGTVGDTLLGAAGQDGQSLSDALNDVADADLGDVFVDKNGTTSYVTGTSIVGGSTPVATIDANLFDEGTAVLVDLFGVVNYATGSATSGTGGKYVAQSTSSQTTHGRYPQDNTWNLSTDAQVIDRLNWKIAQYAEPKQRIGALTLDLLTASPAVVTAALSLDLTSILRVTGLPSQTPGGTTQDLIVEGIAETVSTTQWSLTFNVSPKSVRSAWILDDTTYSVLDSTTRLYI